MLFPYGRLRDKLRKCVGEGQSHLENMHELIDKWLETAQINQQEHDVVSKSAVITSRHSSGFSSLAPSRYTSGSSSNKPGEEEDSEDEEENPKVVHVDIKVAIAGVCFFSPGTCPIKTELYRTATNH